MSRLISNGMISFGAASGWITCTGCGSNVSTVSAPSITAWWPRWTPSKVPIATWRSRGSASGRDVTRMLTPGGYCDAGLSTTSGLIWWPATRPIAISSPAWVRRVASTELGRAAPAELATFLRYAARSRQLPRRYRSLRRFSLSMPRLRSRRRSGRNASACSTVSASSPTSSNRKRPNRRPPQALAIRIPQCLDQCPYIRPRRALDLVFDPAVAFPNELRPVDLDFPLRRFDRLPSVRPLVEPLTPDFDRGGQRHSLHHSTGRQREIRRQVPGLGQLPVRVPRGRAPAQSGDGPVGLGQRQQVTLQPGRPAQQDEQQPGRKRVERARVTSLHPKLAPHPGDDVVRGDAGGLVAEKDARGAGARDARGPRH